MLLSFCSFSVMSSTFCVSMFIRLEAEGEWVMVLPFKLGCSNPAESSSFLVHAKANLNSGVSSTGVSAINIEEHYTSLGKVRGTAHL